MSLKKVTVLVDTEVENDRLKKAFLDCGLVDIKYVKVEDEDERYEH